MTSRPTHNMHIYNNGHVWGTPITDSPIAASGTSRSNCSRRKLRLFQQSWPSPIQRVTIRPRPHRRRRSRCGSPQLRRVHLKRHRLRSLTHTTWIATTTVRVTRRAPSYERCKTERVHRPRQPQADASGATRRQLDDPPPLQLFASTNEETKTLLLVHFWRGTKLKERLSSLFCSYITPVVCFCFLLMLSF